MGKTRMSKKTIKQVILTNMLSECTNSWNTLFSCSVLHYSGIPLTLYIGWIRVDTTSKDHRINSVKTQNRMIIGSIPWNNRITWSLDEFRGNTESNDDRNNSVEILNQMIIKSMLWKARIKLSSDQFRGIIESNADRTNSVETLNHMIIRLVPWKHRIKWSSDQFRGSTNCLTFLKDKHQADDRATYVLYMYKFVNDRVRLFGVASSCCHRGHPWCFRALCSQWRSRAHFYVISVNLRTNKQSLMAG